MIKLRPVIYDKKSEFQEIEHNDKVIGSIYSYYINGIKNKIYQTLVPNLEFYKKKYDWYGEEDGFMFIYFNNMNDLLRAKGIRNE